MLTNFKDKTIERERIKRYRYLINEYELIKRKKHPKYKFVSDFYNANNLKRQTFIKYYNRFKLEPQGTALLPRKRGPRWKTRRPIPYIENKVLELRCLGNSRYEIHSILKPKLKGSTPSPSGIYHIFKRYHVNRLTQPMKQTRRKIIKEKAGELGHIDCHYLSPDLLENESKRYYLVCVIDDCTRLAWAEITDDIKSITVMFATLKCFNFLTEQYQIKFERVLTDNGAEFGSGPKPKNKQHHPFERLLLELGVKHSYTRPFRPQTNGKVERFWKTLRADLLEDVVFDNLDHFRNELMEYLVYYNEHRPHQSLDNIPPAEFAKSCQRIT